MMKTEKPILLHILAIALLTAIFYYPALTNDFIWDDDDYILNNFAIQRSDGLKDIWFSYRTPQYYPVVFTSFWLEYHLWGKNPLGYHILNLVFHILNALLVYAVLSKLKPALAFPVALIFALHPVQVETVAWITERKNIYGAFFYLLALLYYLRFEASERKRDYAFSFFNFLMALLSKSITVTFVMVPLLIRWWRRQPLRRIDILRLIPFGIIGLMAGLNTIYLELVRVGAKGNNWGLPLLEHIILPGKIILFYIVKLLFPFNLMFVYPRWNIHAGNPWQWLPVSAILVFFVLGYIYRERVGRGALAAAFFFCASLFPALGFFNVYPMIYSYVADHFQYIAGIGMILFMCGAAAAAFEWLLAPRLSLTATQEQLVSRLSLSIVVLACGFQVFSYSHAFANREALFKDVIRKNPAAWMAHNNLGLVYLQKGEISKAWDHYQETLKIKPDDCVAHTNMGAIYRSRGMRDKAKAAYEACLAVEPDYSPAYNNLGLLYVDAGDLQRARELFEKAAALDPMAHQARLNLGQIFLLQKNYAAALQHYQQAIAIYPYYQDAYLQMGILYSETEDTPMARRMFQKVLQINPDNIHAHNNLGLLDRHENQLQPAIRHFREAVRLDPGFAEARFNLGETLLAVGQTREARFHFRELARQGIRLPQSIQAFLNSKTP